MTNGNERFERIERIREQVAISLHEMAARQQYHDEALERHDADMKEIAESIRTLARVAEIHQRKLEDLEGG